MASGVVISVAWMIVGAVGALAAMWWWSRRRKRSSGWLTLLRLRRELRRLTHDPDVAERLVAKERERNPELSEVALLRKVIRRLTRDRER
ncbi:MAG TPA: hypothetical protein VIL20_02270 [Sandaracinaceae bacterium]